MPAYTSPKLKDKHVAKLASSSGLLLDGEKIEALFKVNKVSPTMTILVVTNGRAFGLIPADLKPQNVVARHEIASAEIAPKKFGGKSPVSVTLDSGDIVKFGDSEADEAEEIRRHLTRTDPLPALIEQTELDAARDSALDGLVIGQIGKAAAEEIKRSCRDGERPEFVIAQGSGGALAAFADRCMIVKKGALTSFMAGSLGGGRVTTFFYGEITGIEYNAGFASGVLEILTPSYQGTANKDFWRGTNKGRNKDSNDPFTLSNTLPLNKTLYNEARDKIDHLRQMVVEAKRPAVAHAPQPADTTEPSLADALKDLAKLRDDGLLDDSEFNTAKSKLLAKHGLA